MLVCRFFSLSKKNSDVVLKLDCLWIFAQHFCNRLGPSYLQLKNILDENNTAHAEILGGIKRRFRDETYTRESIAQIIHNYPELVRKDDENLFITLLILNHRSIYSMLILPLSIIPRQITHSLCTYSVSFSDALVHFSFIRSTLSRQRLQSIPQLTDEELYNKMLRAVPNKHDFQVLECFLVFNQYVPLLYTRTVITAVQARPDD